MELRIILLPLCLLGVAACEHAVEPETDLGTKTDTPTLVEKPKLADPQNFNEVDRDACTTFGGTYTRAGLLGAYNCFVDYNDGGTACTDSSQCEGKCISKDLATDPPTGTCQVDDNPFGCYAELREGLPPGILCVD